MPNETPTQHKQPAPQMFWTMCIWQQHALHRRTHGLLGRQNIINFRTYVTGERFRGPPPHCLQCASGDRRRSRRRSPDPERVGRIKAGVQPTPAHSDTQTGGKPGPRHHLPTPRHKEGVLRPVDTAWSQVPYHRSKRTKQSISAGHMNKSPFTTPIWLRVLKKQREVVTLKRKVGNR